MHDLAQIAGVDIAPGVALAEQRIIQIGREVGVFMRLDHVADAQRVDVGAVAHGESAGGFLVHQFGQAVAVHRITVVIFFQREGMVILVPFGKADAIGGFGTGEDHFGHAQFHRGFDHVVGADGILREGGVVGVEHHPRHGCEMHDGIGGLRWRAVVVAVKTKMGGQGVENLAAVGDVGDQRVDAGMIERLEIKVQDRIALGQQIRHGVTAGLAGAAGEDDAFCHGKSLFSVRCSQISSVSRLRPA